LPDLAYEAKASRKNKGTIEPAEPQQFSHWQQGMSARIFLVCWKKHAAASMPILHLQVLVATKLQRTPSLACPDLFMFEDHFVFEGLIGKSPHSEVT
jgi:hypothetical protein